jgi:hypothetical protein
MATQGIIRGEKNNFLYNAKKNSFIYLYAESICIDEEHNCYVSLESLFRTSFEEIIRDYSSEYKQVYVPVTVLDEEFTENSMILHFDLMNYPSIFETVSRFEAKDMQESVNEFIIFRDVNVKFSNIIKNNDSPNQEDSFSRKERKIIQKQHYQTMLQKEYELQGLALGESEKYKKATILRKKSEKMKKKIQKNNLNNLLKK